MDAEVTQRRKYVRSIGWLEGVWHEGGIGFLQPVGAKTAAAVWKS
jgi:hypothetical protein